MTSLGTPDGESEQSALRFLFLQRGASPKQDLFSSLCLRLIPVSVWGSLMLTGLCLLPYVNAVCFKNSSLPEEWACVNEAWHKHPCLRLLGQLPEWRDSLSWGGWLVRGAAEAPGVQAEEIWASCPAQNVAAEGEEKHKGGWFACFSCQTAA